MARDTLKQSTMKDRLKTIVRYKTNGKQKEFAALMGWSTAYLNNLLKGASIGLQPVIAILKAMPEIDARWLLLGEGSMLIEDKVSEVRHQAMEHIHAVLDLEKFIPVMSPEELKEYERIVTTHANPHFGNEARLRWLSKTAERQMAIDTRVNEAMRKAIEPCRQETAKQ